MTTPTTTTTIAQQLAAATRRLTEGGCPAPRGEAITLIGAVLSLAPRELLTRGEEPVPTSSVAKITDYVERRHGREPLQYILGMCRFRDLELIVDPRVLIPHPFSGPLVEIALQEPVGARVHDVGTGSGALALAVKAARSDLIVTGSDVSGDAVEVACSNARRLTLDVRFTVGPGLPAGDYELVIANLPYQDTNGETLTLAPEFAHEPEMAIVAGEDGLDAIRPFLQSLPGGTRVALEHAPSQSATIRALLCDAATTDDNLAPNRFTTGLVP